jgi:acyl-CoA synthetase (AMP-forming)/AMP-acid ligase II
VTSLPLYYSFGLSILNSHLMTGAEVVLTGESLVSEDFWTAIKDRKCTSLAGVPYSYEMLDRLDLIKLAPDCLKTLTQAGGKLANELIVKFHEFMENRGGRFFVMYGQTEATARISVLPPDRLPEKLDSVGLPLEGGRLEVWKDDRPLRQPNAVGEVVYHGDNVMLGYARAREDIGAGDELGGKLRTGDLGYLDDDGFLHISGRVKRIAKVFGLRINLEELESMLRPNGLTAAIAVQDRVILFSEFRSDDGYHDLRRSLAQRLGIHHSGFVFRHIEKLPLTATGKINYRLLETELL